MTENEGPRGLPSSQQQLLQRRPSPSYGGIVKILLTISSLLLVACARPQPADLAMRGVTVVDMAAGSLAVGQTVLIEGNRIIAVGASDELRTSDDVEVLDAPGQFLIPGLWDMHTHLFRNSTDPEIDRSAWAFPLYVANGVTGVRDMWTDPEDIVVARRWNEERSAGDLLAPWVEWSSEIIDGDPPQHPHSLGVSTPNEARRVVREQKAAGARFIKVYWHLPRDVFFAIVDEARRVNIPVAGHVPTALSAFEASEAGMLSIEHLDGVEWTCSSRSEELQRITRDEWNAAWAQIQWDTFDEGRCAELFAVYAENRTWQVPTLALREALMLRQSPGLVSNPALAYVPEAEKERWDLDWNDESPLPERSRAQFARLLQHVGNMHRAGVPILAGSDVLNPLTVPGFSLHDDLALMVRAGLSPVEALQTATYNVGLYLGRDDIGTVAEGSVADLILLHADPTVDIRNTRAIAGVVLNGRYLNREALDHLLKEAEQAAGVAPQ